MLCSSKSQSVYCCHLAPLRSSYFFFFNDTATTEIYTLSLHDALPIYSTRPSILDITLALSRLADRVSDSEIPVIERSEEHTSELQSPDHLVCRLLLEKKKKKTLTRHEGPDPNHTPTPARRTHMPVSLE